ncbi:MAG: hypothetical protein ABW321_11760, partial [Polyangiales bacterium]
MSGRWRGVLVALAWLCQDGRALAHPTPGSVVYLDFRTEGVSLLQDVPLEELERALHHPLIAEGETAAHSVARHVSL